MKIGIGSDKSGFLLKEEIKKYLEKEGHEVFDVGTTDVNDVKPYYVGAVNVSKGLQEKAFDKGVLICGTGAGVSIVANTFKGVYAVASESIYSARMATIINGANCLCMGGWIVTPEVGVQMVKAFLSAKRFEDCEGWRIKWLSNADKEVSKIENQNIKD
ncbi:MAG TPA: RpiB/LacA/LacB family sugar-phosphate isomerase [Clostridiales bacterium]|nr:RpiB/LacA/LacB family sugar-phosphate isomerase [Clostridiales bacterium]